MTVTATKKYRGHGGLVLYLFYLSIVTVAGKFQQLTEITKFHCECYKC
jgi:hypothetical protein